jgi:hypothetical protein
MMRAAQRHPAADRHLLAEVEIGDRFLGAGDDDLLADDGLQVAHGRIHELRVLRRLARRRC